MWKYQYVTDVTNFKFELGWAKSRGRTVWAKLYVKFEVTGDA